MIKTTTEVISQERVTSIICDRCKLEYYIDNNNDYMEIQEFLRIDMIGGYNSVFGDESTIKLDICQHCLKQTLGDYLRINEGD